MKIRFVLLVLLTTSLFGEPIQNKYMSCGYTLFATETNKYGEHSINWLQGCVGLDANKTIVGLVRNITLKDVFGNILYKNTSEKIITTINYNKTSYIYLETKDNEFIQDELYDKLYPSVKNKSLDVNITIQKILFKDGSTFEPQKQVD